ncbi:MAG: ABC transporter ATP-binding protein [Armatimonadetes bacterium]|nr:ABC transporter ATP-binding protein [Armatimonadota bacterium]
MIRIECLHKEYRNLVAVKNLSLELEEGDIFGFIGPNGAGKTTTIKMLATLLKPTSGSAWIGGHHVFEQPEKVRGLIGYMPDFFGVYDDIKVWEYLDFFASAYRIPRDQRPGIIDDVLELTDLTVKKESYVEELSRGMKQRLCLAKTLVHDPKVLLLDEPASGLDPRARIEIKELLKELRSMGKTIIISSHILPELADFCNKIGIIEQGNLVVAGDVNDIMKQLTGGRVYEIKVAGESDRAVELLSALPDVRSARISGETIQVEVGAEDFDSHRILQTLMENRFRVTSFTEQEADLEDIFMKVTKGMVS